MRLLGNGLQLSKAILVRGASFGAKLQILCSSIPKATTMCLVNPSDLTHKTILINPIDMLSQKQAGDTDS